jgi:hypothetical protein
MGTGFIVRASLGAALALATGLGTHAIAAVAPLAIDTARVTIDGTSNVHEWTASTTKVRVTRAQLGATVAGSEFWEHALKPGGVETFEIAIAAATLTSPKEGLDKNMHKALKVEQHPDITFRLLRFEAGQAGALKGHRRAAHRRGGARGRVEPQDAAHGRDTDGDRESGSPDDRLRHHAAESDARDAENGPEGDDHL